MAFCYTDLPEKHYGEHLLAKRLASFADEQLHLFFSINFIRGVNDIDLLAYHELCGIFLVEVKAVTLDSIEMYGLDKFKIVGRNSFKSPQIQALDAQFALKNYFRRFNNKKLYQLPFIVPTVCWPKIWRADWNEHWRNEQICGEFSKSMIFQEDIESQFAFSERLLHVWKNPPIGQSPHGQFVHDASVLEFLKDRLIIRSDAWEARSTSDITKSGPLRTTSDQNGILNQTSPMATAQDTEQEELNSLRGASSPRRNNKAVVFFLVVTIVVVWILLGKLPYHYKAERISTEINSEKASKPEKTPSVSLPKAIEFNVTKAMESLYGAYNKKYKLFEWRGIILPKEFENEGIYFQGGLGFSMPLFSESYEENGKIRHILLTQTVPELPHECHVCKTLIGGVIFAQVGNEWQVEAKFPYLMVGGAWGKPPLLKWGKIGRGKYGLFESWKDGNQGEFSIFRGIHSIENSRLKPLLKLSEVEDNSKFTENVDVKLSVVESDSDIWDVIVVIKRQRNSGKVQTIQNTYRFNGKKYVLAKQK
jgi:hypothetical protein